MKKAVCERPSRLIVYRFTRFAPFETCANSMVTSYTKTHNLKRQLSPRPVETESIRETIARCYRRNRWNVEAQLRFHLMVGLNPLPLTEFDHEALERILDRMVSSRMLLFLEGDS